MAKQTVVQYVDDIDGKELKEAITISFAVEGKQYEFDTSAAHAKEFRKTLDKYIAVSRKAGAVKGKRGGAAAKRPRNDTKAVREWARESGWDISDRGRIPAEVVEAYEAAH